MTVGDDAEDLYELDEPTAKVAAAKPTPRPWHKPRKHWIRINQWGHLIDALIADIGINDRPFRYLTLPGEHLLDVRYVYQVCRERQVDLRYLGFDTSRKEGRASIAEDEVSRLPGIRRDSDILGDPIQEIANDASVANKRLREFGDFDAINVDLCNCIAAEQAGATDSTMASLLAIVEHQTDRRTLPWLLFVTTRTDRPTVESSVLDRLIQILETNLEQNEEFLARCRELGTISRENLQRERECGDGLDEVGFSRAFGIGFGKWLLGLAVDGWKLRQELSVCYRVHAPTDVPDMSSLAFRFERQPAIILDRTMIARRKGRAHSPPRLTEKQLAVGILDSFERIIDVDRLLHDDPDLKELVTEQNARFMASAHFDYATMVRWGRSSCWKPRPRAAHKISGRRGRQSGR
jgi:hypothetical protein